MNEKEIIEILNSHHSARCVIESRLIVEKLSVKEYQTEVLRVNEFFAKAILARIKEDENIEKESDYEEKRLLDSRFKNPKDYI
jgi:ADP-heptose:LPS heptosyltransferase